MPADLEIYMSLSLLLRLSHHADNLPLLDTGVRLNGSAAQMGINGGEIMVMLNDDRLPEIP